MRLRTHPIFGLQLLVVAMIGTFASELLANDISALAVTIFTLPLLLGVPAGGSHHANGAALITMVIGVITSLWLVGHVVAMGLMLLATILAFVAFRRSNATTALVVAIGVALGTTLFPHLVMNTWLVLLIYCLFIIGCHLIAKTSN
ncbi:hypothetical protein [Lacticaseibacillus porcinae]|uniref:hypothetical protein n=1 Tax=Lacticaseibacillus porcinae TaxID=1123687 RepID=UPI000F767D2A|nr:hypothetical protein [Lacticaseibacillus porcinae]